MVWSGLGVNYKGKQSNWDADAAYFKSIGMNNVRLHLTNSHPFSIGNPASVGTNAYWRLCAQTFLAKGFNVYWGHSGPAFTVTSSNWQGYRDDILGEINYMNSIGMVVTDFSIANELEGSAGGIQIPISSLVRSGTTATATIAKPHNLITGESVTIYGANESGYNGTYTVTATSSTTFTYTVASTLTTPATGDINCYSMSMSQLNNNIRQLVTDIKATGYPGAISYSCYNNTVNGVAAYSEWIANGLGNLDFISLHPYGNHIQTQRYHYVIDGGYLFVTPMVNAFGDKVYVSEFNLDSNNDAINTLNNEQKISYMRRYYAQMKSKVPKAFVYSYVGYLNNDNEFAMKLTDGSFSPMWDVLLTDNGRYSDL